MKRVFAATAVFLCVAGELFAASDAAEPLYWWEEMELEEERQAELADEVEFEDFVPEFWEEAVEKTAEKPSSASRSSSAYTPTYYPSYATRVSEEVLYRGTAKETHRLYYTANGGRVLIDECVSGPYQYEVFVKYDHADGVIWTRPGTIYGSGYRDGAAYVNNRDLYFYSPAQGKRMILSNLCKDYMDPAYGVVYSCGWPISRYPWTATPIFFAAHHVAASRTYNSWNDFYYCWCDASIVGAYVIVGGYAMPLDGACWPRYYGGSYIELSDVTLSGSVVSYTMKNGTRVTKDLNGLQIVNPKPLYRFYRAGNNHHFFTVSEDEKNYLIATSAVWAYERVAYYVYDRFQYGLSPLYRFWSDSLGGHFYTASEYEKNLLCAGKVGDWKFERVSCYVSTAPKSGFSPIYRFWSDWSQSHFYTASESERDDVRRRYPTVWSYEGTAFYAVATGIMPVHLFYNSRTGRYFYTIHEAEKTALASAGGEWVYAGIAFYAPIVPLSGSTPLYRFWSGSLNSHFYTSSDSERNSLIRGGVWGYEGIAYYVYPKYYSGLTPVYRFWSNSLQTHYYTANVSEATAIGYNPTWTYEGVAFYAVPP